MTPRTLTTSMSVDVPPRGSRLALATVVGLGLLLFAATSSPADDPPLPPGLVDPTAPPGSAGPGPTGPAGPPGEFPPGMGPPGADGIPFDDSLLVGFEEPVIPVVRGPGFYLNPALLALYLGMIVIWMNVVGWVAADSARLGGPTARWNMLTISVGAAGVLLLPLSPIQLLGFLVLTLAITLPALWYVRTRNEGLAAEQQVLSPAHLLAVARSVPARLGLAKGSTSERSVFNAASVPIELVTKSRVSAGEKMETPKNVAESTGYNSASQLMFDSISCRATDLHLEPTEEAMAVRYRVDGVMYMAGRVERRTGEMIVNVLKIVAAMDISERRRPQDGSFRVVRNDEPTVLDVRVATQGTNSGEKMSLRLLHQSEEVSNLSGIGLRRHLQGAVREILEQPHGLFLVCGPTGAGKSTTLRAALMEIDTHSRNVITIEDPVEYQLPGINQIEVETKAGQSFASTLRSVLRQDPDVVLIGEIRDGETGTIACQAANTGHMVFSTIHANDSIAAIQRLVELGAEAHLVGDSLAGVLAQRLVRRLCASCREAYRPKAADLRRLRLPVEKVSKFFRPPRGTSTCAECSGIGYIGRTGVFELLAMDDDLRSVVTGGGSASEIRRAATAAGLLSMRREGLQIVVKGLTSLAELDRVVK